MIPSIEKVQDIFKESGFELTEKQYEDFLNYSKLLVEWNSRMNLTAILHPTDIVIKHFLDSILPFKYFKYPENSSLIDVGTGAGFPSIPMKIMNRTIDLTMLDSLNKRVNFLNEVANTIGLDAKTIHGRAEDFGNDKMYREQFDIATARAVAPLSVLCEYCLPYVKVGGYFVALKGSNGDDELQYAKNAIRILGGAIEQVENYSLPTKENDKRTLIVIKKISQTSTKYPRNKSQMTKKPL